MRKITISILSGLLVASMLLQLCGCNSNNNTQNEIARAYCETFCEDVKNGDADKLMTYLNSSEITAAELKEKITPSGLNSEQEAFLNAIKESTAYKVQDPVYDYKAKTATVYLSWEQADYNCEAATSALTALDFKTAITRAPANIITVPVTVDLKGDTPKLINPRDVIDAVYAYNSADNGIMPGVLSDFYKNGGLLPAPKGTYSNVKEVGFKIDFKKELANYRFVPGIICVVSRDKEVLYTSDIINLTGDTYKMTYTAEMAGPKGVNEDGYLTAGKYSFMVFDEHSNEITGFECDVTTVAIEKDVVEFEDLKKDNYISTLVFEFKDDDLKGEAFANKSGWWDYDNTSVGKSAFGSDTKIIGFSLAVSQDNDSELYYEYYYSEESDFGDLSEHKPVFQGSCKPTLYKDQACYDLDYSGVIRPGFYGLVVYDNASRKHVVFTAACIVLEETSKDLLEE